MTEAEKSIVLASLERRAVIADDNGLRSTARLWREYAANVAARPAGQIIITARVLEAMGNT
jgi:hypothetical protein